MALKQYQTSGYVVKRVIKISNKAALQGIADDLDYIARRCFAIIEGDHKTLKELDKEK